MGQDIDKRLPRWAERLGRVNQHVMFDLGGGPRPLKLATVINLQKAGTFPVIALLMWFYAGRTPAATSTAAWLYLAMHGSYGLTWLLKDFAFPDPSWQQRSTVGGSIVALLFLSTYWLAGWVIISGVSDLNYPLPQGAWFALCVSLCILGCVIVVAADVQKYSTLRIEPGLITTGMFRYVRHPNYLGEMMVYGSFALLAWHWLPVVVLALFWGCLFSANMARKEASMSRYPEWKDYRRRTWWLIPYVF